MGKTIRVKFNKGRKKILQRNEAEVMTIEEFQEKARARNRRLVHEAILKRYNSLSDHLV